MAALPASYDNVSSNLTNVTNDRYADNIFNFSSTWITIFFVLCISASVVNFILGFSILSRRRLRKGANILVAVILLLQSFASMTSYPAYALPLYGGLLGRWKAPPIYCNIVMVYFLSLFGVVIWLETVLACNRLCAIVFPHVYHRLTKTQMQTWTICFAIFLGVIWSIPPIFGVSGGYFRNRLGVCSFAQISLAGIMTTAVGTYIPMSISGLCYTVVGIRTFVTRITYNSPDRQQNELSRNATKKRQNFALVTFVQYFIDAVGFLTIPVFVAAMPDVYYRSPQLTVWLRFSYPCGFLLIPIVLLGIRGDYRTAALELTRLKRCGTDIRPRIGFPEDRRGTTALGEHATRSS